MNFEKHKSLKNYNTFGIDVKARSFIEINSINELKNVLVSERDIFILGGGSNMLLTKDINKLVVHINLKGIKTLSENEDHIEVEVSAGENWHDFVLWSIDQGYGGLENLSLIPGNVGTAPIQNIGAYGIELKDTMVSLKALNLDSLKLEEFSNAQCEFGYRNSVFKNHLKGKYIITHVVFSLTKINHKLNSSYGAIEKELTEKGIKHASIKEISNAVIAIRQSKLPDPKELGNSGSFFKNPVIDKTIFDELAIKFPEIPHYSVSESEIKVPAGWLVEQCGFKGKRFGDAGVHKLQALVLVNYGNATGNEIISLAKTIQASVLEKFNIAIEPEVNIF